MSDQSRKQNVEIYGEAYNSLMAVLAEVPASAHHYNPAPGEWSIHEIIIHLSDSDANSYVRCRAAIAEPGKTIMPYGEEAWYEALHYAEQDAEDALALFKALHHVTYKLIKRLPDHVWQHKYVHPEFGTLTLAEWLAETTEHVTMHIAQIRANLAAWQDEQ